MTRHWKADHYADDFPFPEKSKCWFSTSPRHWPSWLMLRWIGFSCSSCQCISSPGHLQIHFVVFPHIFLNFQIIKGPSIFYVIQIWGPERPPPICKIVIYGEGPPLLSTLLYPFRCWNFGKKNLQKGHATFTAVVEKKAGEQFWEFLKGLAL